MQSSIATSRVSLTAKVYRVKWSNKPFFIPKFAWILLKRCKVPGTYYVQDLGEIASAN